MLRASGLLVCIALIVAACGAREAPTPATPAARAGDAGGPPNQAPPRPVPAIDWSAAPPCVDQDQAPDPDRKAVCARLIYRVDDELREVLWTADGLERERISLADVPEGITSFSPDLSRIVVQTPHGHAAGGPLYLYDRESKQLRNLNEQLGLPAYTGVSALRVAGWHPDGGQLLLVNEDDEVTIWLDLEDDSYRALNLGIDSSRMAPPRHFRMALDGSGFTFDSHIRDATDPDAGDRDAGAPDAGGPDGSDRDATGPDASDRDRAGPDPARRRPLVSHLYGYDLRTGETRLLLAVPSAEGRLAATAIAPDGTQLAYLLMRGGRAEGRSEEVHLLDLSLDESSAKAGSRLLWAGNLGPTQPVWAPDGRRIALVRRTLAEPLRAGPRQPPPLGDLWTLSTSNGEATQITFTEALEQPPVWSPDGRYLAFVTADGQIGMVTADGGPVWKIDDPSISPRRIQLAFARLGPGH